jgi:hypothetical protein
MSACVEIITAPYTCFLAPPGTAFPGVSEAEEDFPEEWVRVGTSGDLNYSEVGVSITHSQTQEQFVSARGTPRKKWRSSEGMEIDFELVDLSPKQYALVLDDVPVTSIAGEESFAMRRGLRAHVYTLLLRGPSALAEAGVSQYEVPACYQSSNPSPSFSLRKGPAFLALAFEVVEDTPDQFARLRVGEGTEEAFLFPEDLLYPEDALYM